MRGKVTRAKGRRFVFKKELGEKALKVLEELKTRLVCLSCESDFSAGHKFDETDLCYNPWRNVTIAKDELLTMCPPFSRFCKVELVRVNGMFGSISRKCGDVHCRDMCFQKGFGVNREQCNFCCRGVDLDELSERSAKNFNCPTSEQNIKVTWKT